MNKKLRIIGIIVIVLSICWVSIFMVDRHQTLNLKKPIFAVSRDKVDYLDSSGTVYRGLGYKIEVKSISDNQIIQTTMYMFNKVVAGAIANTDNNRTQDLSDDIANNSNHVEKHFRGTIVEVYANGSFIVEPDENEQMRKSADKISVNVDSDKAWEVGMEVVITYTGEVMESYPVQINTIDVQIYSKTDVESNFEGVTMTVKEDTISKTGATFILKSHKKIEHEYLYGEHYKLERRERENWVDLKPILENYGFNYIGYSLHGNQTKEISVDWEWLYGELSTGKYRITKDISHFRKTADFDKYFISAEFSIK